MDTLLDMIQLLNKRGYTEDFNQPSMLEEMQQHVTNFKIDEVYRYEGMTDPEDEAIVYAISSTSNNRKGILINGFGIYADEKINTIISKLKKNERNI
jgi:hypothetical protein